MINSFLHRRFRDLSKPMDPVETGAKPVLQKLNDVRVLAYDFYGTLFISGVGDIGIDDGSPDAEIFLEVLTHSGINIRKLNAGFLGFDIYNEVVDTIIDDIKKNSVKYPEPDIREVWERVLVKMKSAGLIDFNPEQDLFDRISVEFEARMNPVWPMPGVIETLRHFKSKSMIQGIISNSQFYTPIVLEALTGNTINDLGFDDRLLHWSFEEKMKKPGLEFYNGFTEKLTSFDASLKPAQVLYIGNDMLKDVYPASEIGMKTALFAGDERSLKWRKDDERCKNLVPDLVITELSQLKECV